MTASKTLVLIFQFVDEQNNSRQYAMEVSEKMTYIQIKQTLDELFKSVSIKAITYSRGEKSPSVLINNDHSLNLALKYFRGTEIAGEVYLDVHKDVPTTSLGAW